MRLGRQKYPWEIRFDKDQQAVVKSAFRAWAELLLNRHTPSISDLNDEDISRARYDEADDNADLAIRTCSCGEHIDGYYEYVNHLKSVFEHGVT